MTAYGTLANLSAKKDSMSAIDHALDIVSR